MCTPKEENPFFIQSNSPHGTFRFDKLKTEHFIPALKQGIKEHNEEINKIINNTSEPSFHNTIVALDRSGKLYNHVITVFFALDGADTNAYMQQIAKEMSPMITEHDNSISLNDALFKRIKHVYEHRSNFSLDSEDSMLLQKTYESFSRNGADLSDKNKNLYNELSTKLAMSSLQFEQNSLNAVNAYSRLITEESDLKGMPQDFMDMAAKKANDAGKKGWLLDLRSTCYVPLMTYCANRNLRQEIWTQYNTLCIDGQYSNIKNIKDIINLRLKIANLLGFKNYAEYELEDRMAENVDNVNNLLNKLLEAYKPKAQKELQEIQEFAESEGCDFSIMPWDYSYYSNKLKTHKFALNDEMLKPYFELERVKKGVFGLASQLYGLNFIKNPDIPVYNEEVEAFDVTDENNKYIAVLYTDFHPRAGKRAGAWMTEYKGQWHNEDGSDSRPHITIVMNFTRPTDSVPALLTFSEVETFLHEFGHALHGMLSECKYAALSGTNVYRDFVELPSQIMENWAIEKEFLDQWAKHYQNGETIPDSLIQKIIDSSNFNCGYLCLRQVAFGLQDMAFHTITDSCNDNPIDIEMRSISQAQILPVIKGTGRCATFGHIFSGGYAAGYYSYKWAELLDADAFELFKQNGIFNKQTAESFRNNILKRGATEHPMVLYKRFRDKLPTIDALLKRNNILN